MPRGDMGPGLVEIEEAKLDPSLIRRDSLGRILPGYSTNPRGKSWATSRFVKELKRLGPRALEVMKAMMEDRKHPRRFEAAKYVLDRAYGKAATPLEIDARMTVDARASWAELAKRAGLDAAPAALALPAAKDAEFEALPEISSGRCQNCQKSWDQCECGTEDE